MTVKTDQIKTPKLELRAEIVANTFDPEKRTMDVVWGTGAKGKRGGFWTPPYFEELSMQKSHVRMERLNQGASVLANHNSWSLDSVLGVVERAWIKDGKGHATVRFSDREDIQGIIRDIQNGIIRNLSVGYKVHEYKDVSKKDDKIPTYRAVDWEPVEISFVTIPFDKDAQSRSAENNDKEPFNMTTLTREIEMPPVTDPATTEKNDLENKVTPAENENERGEKPQQPSQTPAATENEQKDRSVDQVQVERQRVMDIRQAVRAAGMDQEFETEHIDKGTSADEVRKLIFTRMEQKGSEAPTKTPNVQVDDVSNRKRFIEAASNALQHRANPDKIELSENGRDFRGKSLLRIAEDVLVLRGEKVAGMTPQEIAERALHTTSDFAEILANTANKSLRMAYEEQPQTFEPFTRRVQLPDFKEISRTQLGDAPELEKVNESGEYKHGTIGEGAEKYKLETYGKIIGVTRQVIVNDDMDALSRIPEMYGRRARDLESNLIWGILNSNPVMADGNNLFSAAHGNLAAGGNVGVIGVSTVKVGRAAMRLQKGLNGLLINLRPQYIVVPAALETDAEQFVGPIVPNQNSQVNPFSGKLQPIAEARLDAGSVTAWYLFASKGSIDIFELATLTGENGPRMTTKQGFEVDGVQFKVSYDVAAKVIDHRGIYKNPGA